MAGGNICIIGPQSSGKTTYLAALVYLQEQHHKVKGKSYTITPKNPDTRKLANKAGKILQDGLHFEPTRIGDEIQSVDDLPFYSFSIEAKPTFFSKKAEEFIVTARDYPGEVFKQLAYSGSLAPKYAGFVDDCFANRMDGALIMLPGWEYGSDKYYEKLVSRLIQFMKSKDNVENYKLAVAMSKCERGEIWNGRLDPEYDLFRIHLKKTTKLLREKIPQKNLKFFALSTFGVLSEKNPQNPRPNREDTPSSTGEPQCGLQDPEAWKPYNLIEPLLWLVKTDRLGKTT